MFTIRKCENEQDIKTIAELAKIIWNEYFISLLTQAQIDYMVEKFQSYPALSHAIQEEGYTYFMGFENEQLIGYCGVRVDDQRLFLSKLYVKKEARGQGISSKLFQQAVEFAKAHKLQAIYLTCNKYNQHSMDVYQHKGFNIIDAQVTDIGQGYIMDDYVLELSL